MNTQKIWLGAVTVLVSMITLGCGGAALPATSAGPVSAGGDRATANVAPIVASVPEAQAPTLSSTERYHHRMGSRGNTPALHAGRH